jgi:hypothetical protein
MIKPSGARAGHDGPVAGWALWASKEAKTRPKRRDSKSVPLHRVSAKFSFRQATQVHRYFGRRRGRRCAADRLCDRPPVGGPIWIQARLPGLPVHPVERLLYVPRCGCSVGAWIRECRGPHLTHRSFDVLLRQYSSTRVRKLQRKLCLILAPLLDVARNARTFYRAGWLIVARCLPRFPKPGILCSLRKQPAPGVIFVYAGDIA